MEFDGRWLALFVLWLLACGIGIIYQSVKSTEDNDGF